MTIRVLFISENYADVARLAGMLRQISFQVQYAPSLQQARWELLKHHYAVVLTEASLPDGTWVDALRLTRQCSAKPAVLVTDRQADPRLWEDVLEQGGYDVVAQPFYDPEVRRIVQNACTQAMNWEPLAAAAV